MKHGQEGHVGRLFPTKGSYARFRLSCVEVVFPTQKLVERKMEGNFMVFFNGQDCLQSFQLIWFFLGKVQAFSVVKICHDHAYITCIFMIMDHGVSQLKWLPVKQVTLLCHETPFF